MRALSDIRAFLLDMDGTLVVGASAIPGAAELLSVIRRAAAPMLVLTNNSSEQRSTFHARLQACGLDVELDEVLTSGDAAVEHLLSVTRHRRVFLLGTRALRERFVELGIELAGIGEPAPCVVAAFDKTLTYAGLEHACLLLADGADYIATHPDATCITPRGLIPDVGAILAAIEVVTGRRPFVVGKPEQPMIDAALGRLGSSPSETLLVGDQCDTDMTMGRRAGLYSVLTLTGETPPSDNGYHPQPDLVVPSVARLAQLLADALPAAP